MEIWSSHPRRRVAHCTFNPVKVFLLSETWYILQGLDSYLRKQWPDFDSLFTADCSPHETISNSTARIIYTQCGPPGEKKTPSERHSDKPFHRLGYMQKAKSSQFSPGGKQDAFSSLYRLCKCKFESDRVTIATTKEKWRPPSNETSGWPRRASSWSSNDHRSVVSSPIFANKASMFR